MKVLITTIIGILLLASFVSAEVISIEPEVLEPFSIYSGESIIRNITIKTDGNYLVYLSWGVEGNLSNMEGFHVDYESPIQVNKERELLITILADYNYFPDSFTIYLYASTERVEEVIEEPFIQNETIEIGDLELDIDSNGTGNITIKTFSKNPVSGFGIPALNKFFEINVSEEIEQGMNETTIKVYYTDDEVDALGINESTLRLYFYNETIEDWQLINSWVDAINNIVYGKTTHFSVWGVFGEGIPSVPSDDDDGRGWGCKYDPNYDWKCSEWSECVDGKQTRTCKKYNNCHDTHGKPDEIRNCSVEEPIGGCGTVAPGLQDECCQNLGYSYWDTEDLECKDKEPEFPLWAWVLVGGVILILIIITIIRKYQLRRKDMLEKKKKK